MFRGAGGVVGVRDRNNVYLVGGARCELSICSRKIQTMDAVCDSGPDLVDVFEIES